MVSLKIILENKFLKKNLMGEIFKNKMFVNQLASHIKKKKTGRL
jgi:hypothetical protein